jgi:hypothetical protein
VINNSGLPLKDMFLIYVNKEYIELGEEDIDLERLFIFESVLDRALDLQEYIKDKVAEEKAVLMMNSSPEIGPGPHCFDPYPCDFLGHCWKHVEDKSLLEANKPVSNEHFYKFLDRIEHL